MKSIDWLAPCQVPHETYQKQKRLAESIYNEWRTQVSKEIMSDSKAPDVHSYIPDALYLAANEKWRKEPFGAVNDMEHSASIIFVAKYLLDYYEVPCTVLQLKDAAVKCGYRAWRFENTNKVFYTPNATDLEVQQTIKEVYEVDEKEAAKLINSEIAKRRIGKPYGIGGMHILLDNIISQCTDCAVVFCTRLSRVQDLYENLHNSLMVPMLVKKRIYHNIFGNNDGHFVILVSIKDQVATVIDSNVGYVKLPISRLLAACDIAWNLVPKK